MPPEPRIYQQDNQLLTGEDFGRAQRRAAEWIARAAEEAYRFPAIEFGRLEYGRRRRHRGNRNNRPQEKAGKTKFSYDNNNYVLLKYNERPYKVKGQIIIITTDAAVPQDTVKKDFENDANLTWRGTVRKNRTPEENKADPAVRTSFNLPTSLRNEFDEVIKTVEGCNKSRAIEEALRDWIKKNSSITNG